MERDSSIIFQMQPPNSFVFDVFSNVDEVFQKFNDVLLNPNIWHRFEISNVGSLHRNEILRIILDSVFPLDLIPVCYVRDLYTESSYFLARNCSAALRKLANNKFIIEYPANKKAGGHCRTFKIKVVINFSNISKFTVDIQKNVLMVLQKRMLHPQRYLDLDSFEQDPDLLEFCPLSQSRIALFVLNIAKTLRPNGIILSNNDLTIVNRKLGFPVELKMLDLSNNKISSFNDVQLSYLKLTELILNGNPLCQCNENQYVHNARLSCPSIELLDGIPLSKEIFPVNKKNYLCTVDSYDLVCQFVELFFNIYDSSERNKLIRLYNPLAVFSLTSLRPLLRIDSNNSLNIYNSLSRNLIMSMEGSEKSSLAYTGIFEIINLFVNKFPPTEHDPTSFTVDLVHKTSKCSIITVTGVFRDIPSTTSIPMVMGFMRTFVLEHTEDETKCTILNDQLHVYEMSAVKADLYFKESRNSHLLKQVNLTPQTKADFDDLVFTMCDLTKLREVWARQCLQTAQYDLGKALNVFLGLYKTDQFPQDAFA